MRKSIFIITLIMMSQCLAVAQDVRVVNDIANRESGNFTQKLSFAEGSDYGTWDLVYQRMKWKVDPAVRFIKGEVTSHFKSQTDLLEEIEFDLHDDLIVDSVYFNGNRTEFTHYEHKINVAFEEGLTNNTIDSVKIFYQGVPPEPGSGYGSFTQSTHSDSLVPITWTLSEPYGAMEWWPCKQSLTDKIDSVDIIVTTPKLYRTASNGILVSETVNDSLRTMHWKHRFPIVTYLVAFAVTNYVDYTDTVITGDGQPIKILNFVYPEDLASAKSKTPATAEIMEFFNNLIGEYPFAAEKYGHAQFEWRGGMEHQTMSFMGNFNYDLVAHELAHQWFGNYITLGSWHHIWLNEGFATYMTGLAYENLDDKTWWPRWKQSTVEQITSQPGGSVYVEDTTSISRLFSSRLSYSKGAYLLHMLRWILGDEDFFQGMRNYFNDPQVANGFARHEQFVGHMETAGDTSLTEFFSDWYYGEGFPVYSLEYRPEGASGYTLTLSQSTTDESINFFEMPVPVRLYNFGKTDSMDFRLNHTQNGQEFQIDPGFEISSIQIDPDYQLISKTTEVLHIPDLETSGDFNVYPNPVFEELNLQLPRRQRPLLTEIFDQQGKKVKQFYGTNRTLDVRELPKGIYFIRILTPEKQFVEKFSKW